MKQLREKTALVTGATGGIGRKIVHKLAEHGVNIVLSSRSPSKLETLNEEIQSYGVNVSHVVADVSSRDQIKHLAEKAETVSGGIDILINNAAIESATPYDKVEIDSIEQMIAVNQTAPMILTRLLLPKMIKRGEGHIINISSLSGLVGTPFEEVYSTTKHALVGFSRSLRLSLAHEGHNVDVSVLCPSFVEDAGMYHSASNESGVRAPFMLGTVPLAKVGKAVIRAITKNKPEIVLSGKPILPFLVTQTILPKLADRMSAQIGVPAMFKQWADIALKSEE